MHKIIEVNPDTKTGICIKCGSVEVSLRWNSNKTSRAYQCKKREDATRRKWWDKNPHKVKQYHLKRLYGVTIDPATIPSICEVCSSSDRKIAFDHDHDTGDFRGWLCTNCNSALGLVNDDVEVLEKLIEYIKNRKPI